MVNIREDPEREDGKWMRTEGTKPKKESGETLKVVDLAEVEENQEEVEWRTEGETQSEEEGGDLDPEQVQQGGEGDETTRPRRLRCSSSVRGTKRRRKQARLRPRRNGSTE